MTTTMAEMQELADMMASEFRETDIPEATGSLVLRIAWALSQDSLKWDAFVGLIVDLRRGQMHIPSIDWNSLDDAPDEQADDEVV